MKTAKQQMLAGDMYQANDPQLVAERLAAKELVFELNALHPRATDQKETLLRQLLGATGSRFHIETPFRCDYGYNIRVGENFYANYNCTILDCAPVTIGDNVLLAPNVSLFTAGHALHPVPRAQEWEFARPITIGNNVWLGGNVVVTPGVRIGDNSIIGAGSVVTRDVPANVVAVGNPCRVLREITAADRERGFTV
ncbi:sugar O-acetyltransferase [Hymenobacter sp. ASUV-10]|uniref:Acetyltransferase n=1 Tax=Hymenobacter aranciens TaxID=3063996 RepID=A0ABT9B5J3_9BACT|nr:sugar O-acetyltransferase [Hymenobacter sp. ASUV-10]MDO7873529.1 sugar O-acetyltransferase [Hymenobacter sp. ASUV-10]